MACKRCLEVRSVDLKWVNISQLTVVVSGQKFTRFFLFNMEEMAVVNTVYRLSISSVILEIFALKVHARKTDRRTNKQTHKHYENMMPPTALCWRRRKKKWHVFYRPRCRYWVPHKV